MCRRTVRTLGLHDCDSVFKILMCPSPHIYIRIFVEGLLVVCACCLTFREAIRYQLPISILTLLLVLSAFSFIAAMNTESWRCAPLQQPGSFRHGVAQSDIFLHRLL